MVKAFLFDMDGVLCDNNAFHRTSWLEYARRLGKELTEDDILTKVYGKTNKEILEYVKGQPLDADVIEHHAELKEALFRDMYRPHFCLTAGVFQFLTDAKAAGCKLAVVTNAPQSNMDFTIEMGELAPLFDARVHAAMVPNPKPAPDIYLKAAELVGVDPKDCVVFEDSLTGIRAGLAAGCRVVAIASTMPEDQLRALTPEVVKDFTQISPHTL